MSLPIARARRKKVPSIQRSPNSSTRSHSRDGVLEAEGGDVAGLLELADLPLVLDQPQLGGDAGEVARSTSVERRRRLRGASSKRRQVVDVAHLDAERVGDLVHRRAAAGPQLAVLPVAEELVGVARGAGPGVEDGLAVLDRPAPRRRSGCRRSRCARCRGGSGSRCRWRAPCRCRPGSTSRSPGKASASRARRAAAYGGDRVRREVELAVAPALRMNAA